MIFVAGVLSEHPHITDKEPKPRVVRALTQGHEAITVPALESSSPLGTRLCSFAFLSRCVLVHIP